jgi:hypothetical protein
VGNGWSESVQQEDGVAISYTSFPFLPPAPDRYEPSQKNDLVIFTMFGTLQLGVTALPLTDGDHDHLLRRGKYS